MNLESCPVSGKIVDILTHSANAYQMVSHYGNYMSAIFSSRAELDKWIADFDLHKMAASAREERRDDGAVRLVGDGWMTKYFKNDTGLDAWRNRLAESAPRKRRTSTLKPKETSDEDASSK